MPIPDSLRAALADRYSIERELGQGGMATVYLAHDLKHDRNVALKVVKPQVAAELGAARFIAEIATTAKLQHPHVLPLFDSGEAAGFVYYVMPYVRGETLRAKLERERALEFEETVRITRDVADALDYAHAEGVVHRDIKPENILLQDGQAILADFGIALAAERAGTARLTEPGYILGTPEYMSPEQLGANPAIDCRSDVYSLGAVVYEMLTGEKPATGTSLAALIARVMQQSPTPLSVLRNTIPAAVDRVVQRSLAKAAVDRFASAGEFARALADAFARDDTASAPTVRLEVAPKRRRKILVVLVTGVIIVGGVATMIWGGIAGTMRRVRHIALGERIQLTTTGNVSDPAISDDGTALAYVASECSAKGCSYAVDVQYRGELAPKVLIGGASALYGLEWSPDRLHLLVTGTFAGAYGTYLLAADGDSRLRLSPVFATFWGNDSVVSVRATRASAASWLPVSGLDGQPVDSIRVPTAADEGVRFPMTVPGKRWLIVGVRTARNFEWRVIDRTGSEADRITIPAAGIDDSDAAVSANALWVPTNLAHHGGLAVIRTALDSTTGRFEASRDTIFPGEFTSMSVTRDGRTMVVDAAVSAYDAWVGITGIPLRDSLLGRRQIASGTTPVVVRVSPDGKRLLIGRDLTSTAQAAHVWSVEPFGSDSELKLVGNIIAAKWSDSSILAFAEPTSEGTAFALRRIGATDDSDRVAVPTTTIVAFAPLTAGAWAWIPADGESVEIDEPGRPMRDVPLPAWFSAIVDVQALPDRKQLAFIGWKQPDEDSLGLAIMDVARGSVQRMATFSGENASIQALADGSIVVYVADTPQSYSIYRVRGPNRVESLGVIRRPTFMLSLAADLRRVAVVTNTRRADAVRFAVKQR